MVSGKKKVPKSMVKMINRTITRFRKHPVTQKALGINESTEWEGPTMTKLKESLGTVLEKHLDDPNASLSKIFPDDQAPEGVFAKYLANGTIEVTDGSKEKKVDAKVVDAKVDEAPAPVACCNYRRLVLTFVTHDSGLGIPGDLLAPEYHTCYCKGCHPDTRAVYTRLTKEGEKIQWPIPLGYAKCALGTGRRGDLTGAYKNNWPKAFHGTTRKAAPFIIATDKLVLPGKTVVGLNGEEFTVPLPDGHLRYPHHRTNRHTGERELFEPMENFFLTQSVPYVETIYARKGHWKHPETGDEYDAYILFEFRLKPKSYNIGQETIGAKTQIDKNFNNDELEMYTKNKVEGSMLPSGLLVKLVPRGRAID